MTHCPLDCRYVLVNVSMVESGWVALGNFSVLTDGNGSARHAAVVVDTLGANGCVVADAVRWDRVANASMSGGCADPAAANYDPAAPLGKGIMDDDANYDFGGEDEEAGAARLFSGCLYVGGRGLTQRAWSMMAPGYEDGPGAFDSYA